MKRIFSNTLGRAALVLAVASMLAAPLRAASSDLKIGQIDLKKVFDGYYKTKQADAQLKERVTDSEKVLKGMMDDYQKAGDDYKKLVDGSNDQAVSAAERDKRKANAEKKLLELQEIERSVKQFRATTQNSLDEQRRRMREEILGKIRELINDKAKKGSFTHIFDSAAEGKSETSVLLYTNGQNDMTDEILTELNASAPAETKAEAKPETKPETKPALDTPDPKKKK